MGESCNIKWNTYTHHLADMLGDILTSELYSDVGLECEGGRLNAHRAVLSACSPFFKHIFEEDDQEVMRDDHPVIWMPGIQMSEMEAILQFMYCGQTNFEQKQTYRFLSVGKHLGIKELDRDITLGVERMTPEAVTTPRCRMSVISSTRLTASCTGHLLLMEKRRQTY